MSENKGRNKGYANLIPCKPGETANPNGRPLGQKNYATLYREALIKIANLNGKEPDEMELELISNGLLKAHSGDYKFYKDTLDRLLGQATIKTEGINLNVNVEISDKIKKIAEEVKNKLIEDECQQ